MVTGRVLVAFAGGLTFVISLLYGASAYLGRFGVPAGDWSAARGARAVAIDLALFTAFAAHHSLFARTGLKARVSQLVSPALERSLYVWVASLLFIALCWLWQPVPGLAWHVDGPWAALLLATQVAGLALTVWSSKQLGVLDLAGIRQALSRTAPAPGPLLRHGSYRFVRHPLYLGWVLMVWAAPTMTGTRLTFALVSSAYLVLAIPFEERSLRAAAGAEYTAYARTVRWRLLPFVF